MFDWLANELSACKTKQFHLTDGPMPLMTRRAMEKAESSVSRSYREFVVRFGNVKLFRSDVQGYRVEVFAAPRRLIAAGYEQCVWIGRAGGRLVYFDTSQMAVEGEAPIYERSGGARPFRTETTFALWLERVWRSGRRSYRAKVWKQILAGPKPFSAREEEIASARRCFVFRKVGETPGGDVEIEIHNGSDAVLDCIEIGVRDVDETLWGGVKVPVDHIGPGGVEVVARECYKESIAASRVELFELPELRPEDRPFRWELGRAWEV